MIARRRGAIGSCVVAGCFAVSGSAAQSAALPASHLAVRRAAAADTFWTSAAAPAQWPGAHPLVTRALAWRAVHPGVELAELSVTGDGEARRILLVIVRVAPGALVPRLVRREQSGWTIDRMRDDAVLAFNAGQFRENGPWGWLVRNGVAERRPGRGPLAPAFAWDAAGRWRWIAPRDVAANAAASAVANAEPPEGAFQSYPMLLWNDGEVPAPLRRDTPALDATHRDARLALGEDRDGRLLVALTRFDGLGEPLREVAGRLPFGLTTPEMAAVMGALGCRVAVSLDGGTSAQLAVRGGGWWPGWRVVPVGVEFVLSGGRAR